MATVFPKPWHTTRALIALAPGDWRAELVEADDGRPELIATYGALTRRLRSVEEAEAFGKLIGAPAAAELMQ